MQRYFFDFVDQARSELDFTGCEFQSRDAALRLAELLALDESMIGVRLGWNVRVSDSGGEQLFSIPILENPDLSPAYAADFTASIGAVEENRQ